MSALEQSMKDFVASNGLVHLSIDFSRCSDGGVDTWFTASAQWLDPSKPHGRGIATHSAGTIAHALAGMISQMANRRTALDTSEALEVAA